MKVKDTVYVKRRKEGGYWMGEIDSIEDNVATIWGNDYKWKKGGFGSNSRSLILFSSKLSKIIPPLVVDLPCDVANRSMQYHKMFTNWHVNKPSLVCVYSHNGNSWEFGYIMQVRKKLKEEDMMYKQWAYWEK